jgi:ParB family chromosome partitioning protein
MARGIQSETEVEYVVVRNRLRSVNLEDVARIAASIAEHGLQNPITVRPVVAPPTEEFPGGGEDTILVAGLNRLEAVKLLGWKMIPCTWFEGDDRQAEMWEISENLHRADLTTAQRNSWVKRYAELLGDIAGSDIMSDPAIDSRGQRKSQQQTPGIATRIAAETGLSDRTIRRILAPEKAKPDPPCSPTSMVIVPVPR